MNEADAVFIAVMDLQEAKTHQLRLREKGIELSLKTNAKTCTTGCKVTVEVWGEEKDRPLLQGYFQEEYLRNLKGHEPNFEHLSAVYDPSAGEVTCQACGMKFSGSLSECPDCGLCYS